MQCRAHAFPVHRIDENGRWRLLQHIGDIVLLFERVELGIEHHEPVATRFDDFAQSFAEIDEERIVQRHEGNGEEPAFILRVRAAAGGIRSAARGEHNERKKKEATEAEKTHRK